MHEHVWLIPPAALERAHWRKKYRIKCKECSETQIVWGEFAQRMVLAKNERAEVATPKPKPKPKPTTSKPVEHDFSDRKQGWGGEYLFGEPKSGPTILAAHFVEVKKGDTVLLPKGQRYVVRKVVVPWGKDQSWIAEVERVLV